MAPPVSAGQGSGHACAAARWSTRARAEVFEHRLDHAILLGARSLDPPEREYVASIGLRTDAAELEQVLEGTDGVYVALDVDSLEPGELHPFMPEPDGLTLDEVEQLLQRVRERTSVLGAGFSGVAADPDNVQPLTRLALALGL